MIHLMKLMTFSEEEAKPGLLWNPRNLSVAGSERLNPLYFKPCEDGTSRASFFAAAVDSDRKPLHTGVVRLVVEHAPPLSDASEIELPGGLKMDDYVLAVEGGWGQYLETATVLASKLLPKDPWDRRFIEFVEVTPGTTQLVHLGLFKQGEMPAESPEGHRLFTAHLYLLISKGGSLSELYKLLPTLPATSGVQMYYIIESGSTRPTGMPPGMGIFEMDTLPTLIPLGGESSGEVEIG